MTDPGEFNFSRLINRGAGAARGQILAFVNNDVETEKSGWLREMVSHAVRPEVGAVGARLWYPDGRLQHAGVVLGSPRRGRSCVPTFSCPTGRADESDVRLGTKLFGGYGCMHGGAKNDLR